MFARSIAAALVVVALGGCSSATGSNPSPSAAGAASQKNRHTESLSGGGSGYFTLIVNSKHLGAGGCSPGQNQWYTPDGGVIYIDPGIRLGYYVLSTITLSSTAPVTFANSEPGNGDAVLVVSSSSSTYTAAGSFDSTHTVWTPPSAGTFYAGYTQNFDTGPDCALHYVYYQGTLSYTWSQ